MQFRLDNGHNAKYIPTISLVAIAVVNFTNVVACFGCSPALRVQILSTEGVFVLVVLGRESVTVLGNMSSNTCQRVVHIATATCPTEGTNA